MFLTGEGSRVSIGEIILFNFIGFFMFALNSASLSPLALRFGDSSSNATALMNSLPDALSAGYSEAVLRNVEAAESNPAYAGLPKNLTKFFGYAHVGRVAGEKDNPVIMNMAQELADHKGVANTFKDDGPWCALFANYMGFKLSQQGANPGFDYPADFSHKAYPEKFGPKIEFNDRKPGDFYFFYKPDDPSDLQHVGCIVKEDENFYYLFGGNQGSSEVNITKIPKKDKNGAELRPREIHRWPGSDGTASIKWNDDAALKDLLDSYNKPVISTATSAQNKPSSATATASTKKAQGEKPKGDFVEISLDDMIMNYKAGDVLKDESTVVAVVPIKDVSSAFDAAPILKITLKTKDGRTVTKYCEPARDLAAKICTNPTKVVKGKVTIDASKSSAMQMIAAKGTDENGNKRGDDGEVKWQAIKALFEENGKFITEEGAKFVKQDGTQYAGTAHSYGDPQLMSGMTVFRYSHLQQMLRGIAGLEKYADDFSPPPGAHDYNGMRFDKFAEKLVELIEADHKGMNGYGALVAALKTGATSIPSNVA
jgi:hypothetical protein